MSYLNPPYADNFKELCAAMPTFYLDVAEMRAILQAQGHLLDGVCEGMENLVDANFILTADESTIRLWEKALKITYSERLTLDQRRRVVIGYIIGLGHIGEPEIRTIIGQYTDVPVSFSFMRGVITVVIYEEIFGEDDLLDTLLRRIPAHLRLNMSIHIRKQYHQNVPISIGGAVGAGYTTLPVPQDRAASYQVNVSHAAFMNPELEGDPVSISKSYVLPAGVTHGAFVQPEFNGPPVGADKAFTLPSSVAHGTLARSRLDGDPVDIDKSFTLPSDVTHGSFVERNLYGASPSMERPYRGAEDAERGSYYHTHIKPKRID